MKVYVKKEDRRSMIPGIAAAIFMLAFSIGVFVLAMTSEPTLMDALKTYGILLLVALIFFGLGIYGVFAFFKRPKGYKAKLISKKTEIYNGEQITYMEFAAPKAEETNEEHMDTEDEDNEEYIDEEYEEWKKENKEIEEPIPSHYKCYTIGDNDLLVGYEYSLKIKEFNWTPKYVEDYYDQSRSKVKEKVPGVKMNLVFFLVGLVFGGLFLLGILGIFMYPEYTIFYIIHDIFCGGALYAIYKISQLLKK